MLMDIIFHGLTICNDKSDTELAVISMDVDFQT